MRGGKRSKIDRCNRVEKIPSMEYSQQIATNKAAHRVPANREPSYCAPFGRKLVYFFVDLQPRKPKVFQDGRVRELTSWATLSPPLSIPS